MRELFFIYVFKNHCRKFFFTIYILKNVIFIIWRYVEIHLPSEGLADAFLS
jgi:hypothetical protein